MPSQAEIKANLGKTKYTEKKYDDAANLFGEAIEVANEHDPIHLYYSNRCACYLYMNNINAARDDAEACTRYNPTFTKG